MKRDRAAYMREYRAAKKGAHERYDEAKPLIGRLKTTAHEQRDRIAELEAEVARLKRELAARPTLNPPHRRPPVQLDTSSNSRPVGSYVKTVDGQHAFNSRPFTPVPRRK